jgi:hypothetical protein
MRVTVASDKYILLACDKVYRLRLYSTDKRTRAFAGVFVTCGPLGCLFISYWIGILKFWLSKTLYCVNGRLLTNSNMSPKMTSRCNNSVTPPPKKKKQGTYSQRDSEYSVLHGELTFRSFINASKGRLLALMRNIRQLKICIRCFWRTQFASA